jgi:hypothetical protein
MLMQVTMAIIGEFGALVCAPNTSLRNAIAALNTEYLFQIVLDENGRVQGKLSDVRHALLRNVSLDSGKRSLNGSPGGYVTFVL